VFAWGRLVLALAGGAAALLGANLLNDLYDFKAGADQSARQVPGAIETGSGAFVEGRWSLRKGWAATAALFLVAFLCGLALAVQSGIVVLYFAAAGALISYAYVGPPFPLAYRGRGLGELAIFLAFGILPVAGTVLAFSGQVTDRVLWAGAVFGLASVLMLFHHHFLHWEADLAAHKMSPVALLGPRRAALLGIFLAVATSSAVVLPPALLSWNVPWMTFLAAAPPLLLVRPLANTAAGATSTNDMVAIAKAAFGAMSLTGLAFAIALWL
jgi:1,4-dihydroxy-2-naphthoate octaprenyltransferase